MTSRSGRAASPVPRSWRERLSGTPRLALAVVLLAAGALVALTATTPPVTGPVVVAVHRVGAGAVLIAADLEVTRRAVADRPDGALTDIAPAVGHRAVAVLLRGDVVTEARLAPRGFDVPAGRAVATVPVAAARAGVVTAGDVLRLVVAAGDSEAPDAEGAAPAAPVTVADDARVLAVWPEPDGDDVATLVVDVDVGSASRLAVLSEDRLVGFVVVTA